MCLTFKQSSMPLYGYSTAFITVLKLEVRISLELIDPSFLMLPFYEVTYVNSLNVILCFHASFNSLFLPGLFYYCFVPFLIAIFSLSNFL